MMHIQPAIPEWEELEEYLNKPVYNWNFPCYCVLADRK